MTPWPALMAPFDTMIIIWTVYVEDYYMIFQVFDKDSF
jgi:hypothetical protein